ncbi:ParB N-terminal domain-containing protein [Methanosarcina mazei]|uniref:Ribosome recycling factor n=1 Tax=Methanosarcina mazei S-6 TaxID=213585 RepID=A0A0E3RK81_METMZ|nr:ParB N-terminal domain-containing protein [Methanosarcina mazei]AKB64918.1 Ribosome recycling factor [Methanosarcina mazei S-6]
MVTIDPEFKKLIDPLNEQEREDLENSIRENGFNPAFPVILWKNHDIVVDGHNRFEICQKLNVEPKIIEQEFESREAVKEWMIRAQLSRRNLTPEQLSYFRGLKYNTEKSSYGGSSCKNCNSKTNEKLAKEFGVSARTISNDGKYTEAIDKICKVCDISKQELLRDFKKSDIIELADMPENKVKDGLEKLRSGDKKKKNAKGSCPYYLEFDSEINKKIIEMARGNAKALFESLINAEYERRH